MSSELTGHLLVAVPEMEDPHFARTVVLLIRHASEEGAMGVILNRPVNLSMKNVWEKVSDIPLDYEVPANWGGPVDGPLVVLHRQMSKADLPIVPNLFVSTQQDLIEGLVREKQLPFRFFLGYSGWGEGQLEQELLAGGWFLLPPDSDLVFSDPYAMWKHCCSQVGNQVLQQDSLLKRLLGQRPELN